MMSRSAAVNGRCVYCAPLAICGAAVARLYDEPVQHADGFRQMSGLIWT